MATVATISPATSAPPIVLSATSAAPTAFFRSSAGNYYYLSRDSATATQINVFKSTAAPGATWSVPQTWVPTSAVNLAYVAAYQVGDILHVATQYAATGGAIVQYRQFNMATDAWVAAGVTVQALTDTGSVYRCDIVVRSDGTVVITHQGLQETPSMTPFGRVYVSYNSVGAPGTFTTVSCHNTSPGALAATGPIALLGASDRVHICWIQSATVGNRVLKSDNTFGGTEIIYSITQMQSATTHIRGRVVGSTVVIACPSTLGGGGGNGTGVWIAKFASTDTPSVAAGGHKTLSTSLGRTPELLATKPWTLMSAGTDLYLFCSETLDDILCFKSTDAGDTWTSVEITYPPITTVNQYSISAPGDQIVIGSNYHVALMTLDAGPAPDVWKVAYYDTGVAAVTGTTVSGAASLGGSGTTTGEGRPVLATAASLGGAGTATGAGSSLFVGQGAASLGGAGSLTGTAVRVATSAVPLSGAGTVTGSAVRIVATSGSLAGAGTVSPVVGLIVGTSAGSLTGAGAAAAVGDSVVFASGSASLTGAGAATNAASLVFTGSVPLSGAGALTGAVQAIRTAAASEAGSGTVAGAAQRIAQGAASLSGAAALSGDRAQITVTAASLSGSGSVAAQGAVGAATTSGAASFAGTSSAAASGAVVKASAASFAGASPTVGRNVLANPEFNDTSAWHDDGRAAAWSISGGRLSVSTGYDFAIQDNALTPGETYNFDLAWEPVSGVNLRIVSGPDILAGPFSINSTTVSGSFTATTPEFSLEADLGVFTGYVDYITARTTTWAARIATAAASLSGGAALTGATQRIASAAASMAGAGAASAAAQRIAGSASSKFAPPHNLLPRSQKLADGGVVWKSQSSTFTELTGDPTTYGGNWHRLTATSGFPIGYTATETHIRLPIGTRIMVSCLVRETASNHGIIFAASDWSNPVIFDLQAGTSAQVAGWGGETTSSGMEEIEPGVWRCWAYLTLAHSAVSYIDMSPQPTGSTDPYSGQAGAYIDVSNWMFEVVPSYVNRPSAYLATPDNSTGPLYTVNPLEFMGGGAALTADSSTAIATSGVAALSGAGAIAAQAVKIAAGAATFSGVSQLSTDSIHEVWLDPTQKTSGIILSNSNLTAVRTGAGYYEFVRATQGRSTGERFCSFTITADYNVEAGIGLIDSDIGLVPEDYPLAANSTFIGAFTDSIGFYLAHAEFTSENDLMYTGMHGFGGAVGPPGVYDMYVSFYRKLIWVRRDGGPWNGVYNGDPISGTGGCSFAVVDPYDKLFPALDISVQENSAYSITANFGDTAYPYPPPGAPLNWSDPEIVETVVSASASLGGSAQLNPVAPDVLIAAGAATLSGGSQLAVDSIHEVWLDPNYKTPGIVLSESNLKATRTGAGYYEFVRASQARSSGIRFCSFTITGGNILDSSIGLVTAAYPLTPNEVALGLVNNYSVSLYLSYSYISCSNVNIKNVDLHGTGNVAPSGVYDLLVNNLTKTLWVRLDGGPWNGDPSANPMSGTGGAYFGGLIQPGPLFPALDIGDSDPGISVTVNFGDTPYPYAKPVGALDWSDPEVSEAIVSASATLSGASAVAASAAVVAQSFASFIGAGTASSAANALQTRQAIFSGVGSLAGVGTSLAAGQNTALLPGVGTLAAFAQITATVSTSFGGVGALTGSVARIAQGSASFSGTSAVQVSSRRVAAAALTAFGITSLDAASSATLTRSGVATLSGSTSLDVAGNATKSGVANLAGSAALLAGGTVATKSGAANLAGSTSLEALSSTVNIVAASAALGGSSEAIVVPNRIAESVATFYASSTMEVKLFDLSSIPPGFGLNDLVTGVYDPIKSVFSGTYKSTHYLIGTYDPTRQS